RRQFLGDAPPLFVKPPPAWNLPVALPPVPAPAPPPATPPRPRPEPETRQSLRPSTVDPAADPFPAATDAVHFPAALAIPRPRRGARPGLPARAVLQGVARGVPAGRALRREPDARDPPAAQPGRARGGQPLPQRRRLRADDPRPAAAAGAGVPRCALRPRLPA